MENAPAFERENDHEFKVGEKVLVIDPNGFDLWEGEIKSVEGAKFSLHYPEYPTDDETVEGTERILVRNRTNNRIFKEQEQVRQQTEEEEEGADEEKDDEEENYNPEDAAEKDD